MNLENGIASGFTLVFWVKDWVENAKKMQSEIESFIGFMIVVSVFMLDFKINNLSSFSCIPPTCNLHIYSFKQRKFLHIMIATNNQNLANFLFFGADIFCFFSHSSSNFLPIVIPVHMFIPLFKFELKVRTGLQIPSCGEVYLFPKYLKNSPSGEITIFVFSLFNASL